jgi:hypothetical protein
VRWQWQAGSKGPSKEDGACAAPATLHPEIEKHHDKHATASASLGTMAPSRTHVRIGEKMSSCMSDGHRTQEWTDDHFLLNRSVEHHHRDTPTCSSPDGYSRQPDAALACSHASVVHRGICSHRKETLRDHVPIHGLDGIRAAEGTKQVLVCDDGGINTAEMNTSHGRLSAVEQDSACTQSQDAGEEVALSDVVHDSSCTSNHTHCVEDLHSDDLKDSNSKTGNLILAQAEASHDRDREANKEQLNVDQVCQGLCLALCIL